MWLLWLYSVFCNTKHTFILHPPPDSWQVFLHTINIFPLLFYIYKTALLPGVLRRSESCCHKSPLPTLSLRTCLVGIFICKNSPLRPPVTKNYWSDSDFWYFSYENMALFLKYLQNTDAIEIFLVKRLSISPRNRGEIPRMYCFFRAKKLGVFHYSFVMNGKFRLYTSPPPSPNTLPIHLPAYIIVLI